jgi:hypothetical protein
MSMQERRLGGSTQVSNLDAATALEPTGKVGGSTRASALAPAETASQEPTAAPSGDLNLLAGSTQGTLVASGGLFGDLPDLDFARRLAEKYLREGIDAVTDFLLRQILQGLTNLAVDAIRSGWNTIAGFPDALQRSFERVIGMRRLNGSEIGASRSVHGTSLINYDSVRVMPSSFFTQFSQLRAFVTFNIIHYPNDQLDLPECVHECTHVAQYQAVGAIYIPQAIHAQHGGGGYSYGNLGDAQKQHKTYRDFNREQQAQIAGDYYRVVVNGGRPSSSGSGTVADYTHYIQQMRSGSYW